MVNLRIGNAYEQLGNKSHAKEYYKKALETVGAC